MNVARIYTRSVVSVPRSKTLQQAAILMRDFHVGALLVTEDAPNTDQAIGIVTDRDLVVQALAEGAMPDELRIDQVMTPEIAGVSESADAHEAMTTMRDAGVRRLAVTGEGGAVVGILSLDDVIDALSIELENVAGVIRSERGHELEQYEAVAALR
ncbi:MAG TPA: CBS domain-containing protein [Burkholderiales bacterium]|nr:CBS domain-containing protein [Burkholderiales bacterium]